jgi:DnaJ-class molecular chaperone
MSTAPELNCGEITDDYYIICPFCGHKTEGYEYNIPSDTDYYWECPECGEKSIVVMQVQYSYTVHGIVGTKTCPMCKGTGMSDMPAGYTGHFKCPHCEGTGKVPQTTADEWWDNYNGAQ